MSAILTEEEYRSLGRELTETVDAAFPCHEPAQPPAPADGWTMPAAVAYARRATRRAIHARLLAEADRLEALPADSYGRERADALREFALELED